MSAAPAISAAVQALNTSGSAAGRLQRLLALPAVFNDVPRTRGQHACIRHLWRKLQALLSHPQTFNGCFETPCQQCPFQTLPNNQRHEHNFQMGISLIYDVRTELE